jgi:hypothetical protein
MIATDLGVDRELKGQREIRGLDREITRLRHSQWLTAYINQSLSSSFPS